MTGVTLLMLVPSLDIIEDGSGCVGRGRVGEVELLEAVVVDDVVADDNANDEEIECWDLLQNKQY